jgi:hypothetical protein
MADFMLTADQQRALARNLLASRRTGHPSKERAAQMALHHDIMAKIIEARQSGRVPAFYWNAPSVALT